jgi:hypothetical protein
MGYGILSDHVLHQIYPNGYHYNPKLPLPSSIWLHKKTLLGCTAWEFMPIKTYLNGLSLNFLSIVKGY